MKAVMEQTATGTGPAPPRADSSSLADIALECGVTPYKISAVRRYQLEALLSYPNWRQFAWDLAAAVPDGFGGWDITGYPEHAIPRALCSQMSAMTDAAASRGVELKFDAHVLGADPLISVKIEGSKLRLFIGSFSEIPELRHLLLGDEDNPLRTPEEPRKGWRDWLKRCFRRSA